MNTNTNLISQSSFGENHDIRAKDMTFNRKTTNDNLNLKNQDNGDVSFEINENSDEIKELEQVNKGNIKITVDKIII